MKKRYAEKTKVLLVNITRLGDMLQATPTIAGIKMENPSAHITVLVEKQFEAVCHCIPNIDEVVSIDLGMTMRSLAREGEGIIDAYDYLTEVVRDLRSRNFDYCLNMSSSAYTALLLKLVGVKRHGGWSSDDDGYRVIESDWAKLFATSVFHHNRQFNSLNLVDVFRCSADVERHPDSLLINLNDADKEAALKLIAEAGFTARGPLVALQAGASQEKRQWSTEHFVRLARMLREKIDARLVLTGAKKEAEIVDPIVKSCSDPNVVSLVGKTNIPQLACVLKEAKLLITGDTGPMHMSVAVGTPVVSMFLASAYGYETGPYMEGCIVLQPVIGCGPCNPNKLCARPDCHDQISPELVATISAMRIKEDVRAIPPDLADPSRVIVYRSFFDAHGFLDLEPLNATSADMYRDFRLAYRRLWLEDLAGYSVPASPKVSALKVARATFDGLEGVIKQAEEGSQLIGKLIELIKDPSSPGKAMTEVTQKLGELDREIEQRGFHYPPLGPLTRMFIFAKENLSGSEALDLASQMKAIYEDLKRRGTKLGQFYNELR